VISSVGSIEILGCLAFVSSLIGLSPQVYKSLRTKSSGDVSMIMLVNYLLGCLFWLFYGVLSCAFWVVLSNAFGCLLSFVAVSQKWYYDKRGGHSCL
jgi:MtN3 and saliva related transmembrane protein